jgi:hypothetical protein
VTWVSCPGRHLHWHESVAVPHIMRRCGDNFPAPARKTLREMLMVSTDVTALQLPRAEHQPRS